MTALELFFLTFCGKNATISSLLSLSHVLQLELIMI